jgi:hypothetical protein
VDVGEIEKTQLAHKPEREPEAKDHHMRASYTFIVSYFFFERTN